MLFTGNRLANGRLWRAFANLCGPSARLRESFPKAREPSARISGWSPKASGSSAKPSGTSPKVREPSPEPRGRLREPPRRTPEVWERLRSTPLTAPLPGGGIVLADFNSGCHASEMPTGCLTVLWWRFRFSHPRLKRGLLPGTAAPVLPVSKSDGQKNHTFVQLGKFANLEHSP
jgi:hypothetical protein